MRHVQVLQRCRPSGLTLTGRSRSRTTPFQIAHLPARQQTRRLSLFSSAPQGLDPEIDTFGNYSVILPPEPFVFGVSHINPRLVPPHIPLPPYVSSLSPSDRKPGEDQRPFHGDPYSGDGRIPLGGEDEARLRRAARLAKTVLDYAGSLAKVGMTTDSIDSAVHDFIISHSAYPSPLLYSGFPKSCCTSINNVLVHGIPDERPLEDGDIINIDITVYMDGCHGDTSKTFLVGDVDKQGRDLLSAVDDALDSGIAVCGPGRPFNVIGEAIQKFATERGYSVSREFTGHGIGQVFHRSPWIFHTRNDEPGVMLPGHCFTIEPCLIQGSNPRAWIFPDGWTASSENCARSAQKEHMVLVTKDGIDVLTV